MAEEIPESGSYRVVSKHVIDGEVLRGGWAKRRRLGIVP